MTKKINNPHISICIKQENELFNETIINKHHKINMIGTPR